MAVKKDAPADSEAPAYFAQYASLWCIMLAFFAMVMTMGSTKSSEFQKGMGAIRNAFGLKGGVGIMPFVNTIKEGWLGVDSVNPLAGSLELDQDVAGYIKGALWREGFPGGNVLNVDVTEYGTDVNVQLPVQFEPGTRRMSGDSRQVLDAIGGVLMGLNDWGVVVCCVSRDGHDESSSKRLAIDRAIALDRYLQKTYKIPGSRIFALGYNDYSYIKGMSKSELAQATLLLLHKRKER